MCSGPKKPNPPPIHEEPLKAHQNSSMLLEFAAWDDLRSLKQAVEVDNWSLDAAAPWYCRSFGPGPKMGFADRTPLMIAALYGSIDVVNYIIASSDKTFDVNRRSEFDGATALHLAAAGGSPNSVETVRVLIDAAADVDAVDNSGRRPGDVIAKQTAKLLESVLKAATASPSSSSLVTPTRESSPPDEKRKEYPPDLTLPDIKNGIYGTDEFRMYTFKVKPCSRAYSHDWTECPFVHPGENARRRDPRKYLYSCVPCPEFRKGSCRNGDSCEYAHGVFECWLHPAQYRTRLCKDVAECNRRVCFFAHKPEELRSVNPTAASVNGLGVPSPRSAAGISNLDLAAAAAAMMLSPSTMSPSAASVSAGMGSPGVWMNQAPPAMQLPSSRLKSSMSARDLDVDFELLGLEGFQQKLFDEIQGGGAAASPRANWATTNPLAAVAAASRAADYSSLFGSQLANPSLTQQLLSGFNSVNSLSSSPTTLNSSSSFGVDHSMAKAIMNSRSAAFAKRSQSFCDRGAVARFPSGLCASPATTPTGLSDWGSPDGKVDWAVQGEELSKFRKSASFAYRNNQALSPPRASSAAAAAAAAGALDEPDLSWVQSLVKDGPANGPVAQQKMFSPWGEEQMVA